MTSKGFKCPDCGALIPPGAADGLCPECLLEGGLNTRSAAESGPDTFPFPETSIDEHTMAQDDFVIPGSVLSEGPGDVIGNYKLLQKIGVGGFGVVYMANQLAPVKRKVALKIIKLGMDTKEVVARFEAERQALAMMEHPNIARVFEAGATETGRPYFVMELVKGIPITEFCDENNLSTKERLDLFMQVCSAVQHAHLKGIIHRDLKPSNVMITLHDDEPVPKVIDFGIAKATQQELTEKTLFTEYGQFIGTPAYMSPEQAQMSGLDIDTRSDIYALGVLLYELLTGRTPFDSRELLESSHDEIRRKIREEDPPKPSTLLSTMANVELTDLARHRRSDPGKLSRFVRGELDWIVMKSLEKDRRRRYETATGLAMDVRRFLEDDPVFAGPPSTAYRLKKFVRRHRRILMTGGAAAFALFIGLSVAGGLWLKESQRAARVEQSASVLILEAERLMEENASSHNHYDDRSFRRAVELMGRVGELLKTNGGGDGELQERTERLLEDIVYEQRVRTLVAGGEEALMRDLFGLGKQEAVRGASREALARAFRDLGWNPLERPVEDTMKDIADGGEASRDRILFGLSAWSDALEKVNPEQAAKLKIVLERADRDPWRQKLRAAIEAEDAAGLEALAIDEGLAHQPTWIVFQLASAREKRLLKGPVEKLLRRAQQEAPASFWTNFALGVSLAGIINNTQLGEKTGDKGTSDGSDEFHSDPADRSAGALRIHTEYDEAIGFLRAALAARPDADFPRLILGTVLARAGHLDEAMVLSRKTVVRAPESQYLLLIAMALRDRGKFSAADTFYRRVLEDEVPGAGHPDRVPALIEYAKSLAWQKKFVPALEHAEQALEIQKTELQAHDPALEATFDVLSEIHSGLGNTEKAARFNAQADELRARLEK